MSSRRMAYVAAGAEGCGGAAHAVVSRIVSPNHSSAIVSNTDNARTAQSSSP